ncbi:HAD family hydrolase [Anaerolineales bacterium]
MSNTLKAILFDLDDTLIDWGDFHGNWREMEHQNISHVHQHLLDNGYNDPVLDLNELVDEFRDLVMQAWDHGRQSMRAPYLPTLLQQALANKGLNHFDETSFKPVLDAYMHNWGKVEAVKVFPDVLPFLDLLKERQIRSGIVTNAYQPMYMRDMELRDFELLDYFPECRISAADVGYLKPHPEIFKAALNQLDLQSHEVVFIGDSVSADIIGAQRMGIKAIWRTRPPQLIEHASLTRPDAMIYSFEELPAILSNWFEAW